MTSKILIKNVFYMLAYAASCLNMPTERNLDSEKFEHIEDLFAFILNSWMSQQIKRGLYRNYLDHTDNLSTMKGKLNINGTINNIVAHRRQLSCNFDELTINNLFNQIIKSAMLLLLRQVTNVSKEQKTSLRLNLHLLPEIQEIDLFKLNWSVVKFNRFNKNYEWPILICQYLVNNLLPSERDGADHFCIDIDKSLSKLFENFVLNYFKFHYKELIEIDSGEIRWFLTSNQEHERNDRIPKMNADIRLTSKKGESRLIIDTKYYSKTLQSYFKKEKYHSHNLYQLFTYVKNDFLSSNSCCCHKNASGMLLYAKTEDGSSLDDHFEIDNHDFFIKTIDLNTDFSNIKTQLNCIVDGFLKEV